MAEKQIERRYKRKDPGKSVIPFACTPALALLGGASAFVATLCLLYAMDQWPVYHRVLLPIADPWAVPATIMANLVPACLLTALVPLLATALLRPLRRETLGGYMLICFLLPLPALLIPNSQGIPLLLAVAGMFSGMFWWFAYRKPAIRPGRGARGATYAWVILALAALLIGGTAVCAHYEAQFQETQEDMPENAPQIAGGVALGADVLLYDDAGHLKVLKRADWSQHDLPVNGVIAVKGIDRASAVVLSAPPLPGGQAEEGKDPAGAFSVSLYRSGAIESLGLVAYDAGDRPGTLALRQGVPLVVSDRAVHIFDPATRRWRRLALSPPGGIGLPGGGSVAAVARDGRTLFVGLDKGEWGGGMVAIDLANGQLHPIEARQSAHVCAGPLNSQCDPVTGVVADPEHPHCVLASVGLSHLLMHGRLVRVCPDRVELVFEHPLESPAAYAMRQIAPRRPSQTEAFLALAQGQDGHLWAVSPFALYRRDAAGWSAHIMPQATRHAGLYIAPGPDGALLLSTMRNARFSLSGAPPRAIPAP